MRQRLAVAQAMLGLPNLLVLERADQRPGRRRRSARCARRCAANAADRSHRGRLQPSARRGRSRPARRRVVMGPGTGCCAVRSSSCWLRGSVAVECWARGSRSRRRRCSRALPGVERGVRRRRPASPVPARRRPAGCRRRGAGRRGLASTHRAAQPLKTCSLHLLGGRPCLTEIPRPRTRQGRHTARLGAAAAPGARAVLRPAPVCRGFDRARTLPLRSSCAASSSAVAPSGLSEAGRAAADPRRRLQIRLATSGRGSGSTVDLADLATVGAPNFTLFTLFATSGFALS